MGNGFESKSTLDCGPAGERVFALPYFDDSLIYRRTVLSTIFRFDDVVDPEVLRNALTRLIGLPGWSVLGARLRHNRRHGLEYRVPAEYSQSRPAFLWSTVQHDTRIADHEQGRHIPHVPSAPAVLANLDLIAPLMHGPGYPTKVDDYLDRDIPQLGVYVVSFRDATLVTVSWPHTFTDAMGFGDLMEAWCLIVQGREDEVRPLHDLEHDHFRHFGISPTCAYGERKRILNILELTLFGFRKIYETLRHRGEEDRIICLPGPTMKKLHREALRELAVSKSCTKPEFLSEGDILLAWWAKVIARQYQATSKRTLAFGQVFGHRTFHEKALDPSRYAHLGNVHFTSFAYLRVCDVNNMTLCEIAQEVRKALIKLSSPDQLDALAKMHRQRKDRYGLELVSGDYSMQMATLSNWSKARLFDLDFSAAVIHGKKQLQLDEKLSSTLKQPLRPSFVYGHHGFSYWMALRNNAFVTGKDHQGNYWLGACIQKKAWAAVERAIAEYASPNADASTGKVLPNLRFSDSKLDFDVEVTVRS